MTRLVSSRWLGERGEHLLCFPSWGISETKCTCIFCFLVVVTLALWYFVVLCIRCIVAVLTKVFTLAFKKNECELLGIIHSRRYVLGSVFVYILTCACHLSCLLLNLVSDVHLKFKGIKTYTGSFISLVFKLKWYFRLPFCVLPSFHGGPCLVL